MLLPPMERIQEPAIVQDVRKVVPRLVILGIVWMMTPGLTEATENLWHLVRSGHTAHSVEAGPDHAPEDDEHGCSGAFHLCSCHHTPPVTLAEAPTGRAPAPPAVRPGLQRQGQRQSPALPGPYRPPRA